MGKKYSFLQNTWYGGISDDKILGLPSSVQDAQGINIYDNPSSFQLSNLMEKDTDTVVTVAVEDMATVKTTGDIVGVGAGGKVYVKKFGTTTWIEKYTVTGNNDISNVEEFNNFIYFTTSTKLYRIASIYVDSSDWNTEVVEYKEFTNGSDMHPMREAFNRLYIGDGDLLAELKDDAIDITTPANVGLTSVDAGDLKAGTYSYRVSAQNSKGETLSSSSTEIVLGDEKDVLIEWDNVVGAIYYNIYGREKGVEKFLKQVGGSTLEWTDTGSISPDPDGILPLFFTGDTLKIFGEETILKIMFNGSKISIFSVQAENSKYIKQSRIYYWNGVSDSYNDSVHWMTNIVSVIPNAENYVIAGDKPAVYVPVGYKKTLIKQIAKPISIINPNAITVKDDRLLIGISSTDGVTAGIRSFSALNNNYPMVLNHDYLLSVPGSSLKIHCLHVSGDDLYASWSDSDSVYGIDKLSLTKYADTGYVTLRNYFAESSNNEKNSISTSLSFAPLNEGEKIVLYTRKDWSENWSELFTIDYEVEDDREKVSKRDSLPFANQQFHFLEFKIQVWSGTDNLTTPQIFEFKTDFEYVETNQ